MTRIKYIQLQFVFLKCLWKNSADYFWTAEIILFYSLSLHDNKKHIAYVITEIYTILHLWAYYVFREVSNPHE